MLNLQHVVDAAHRGPAEPFDRVVDLGFGIRCRMRVIGGATRVEYSTGDRLVATAYVDQDQTARVDVEAAQQLGTMDLLLMMSVMNLANSRASQMSFVANLNRPCVQQV